MLQECADDQRASEKEPTRTAKGVGRDPAHPLVWSAPSSFHERPTRSVRLS